jgi:hypothetical protein
MTDTSDHVNGSYAVPVDGKRLVILTDDNFDSWRTSLINNLVLENLEDLILGGLPPVGETDSAEQRRRVATTMICMTLDKDNYSCFVDCNKLCEFEPTKLYNEIVDYHVSRSLENAATIWDRLIAFTWVEGDLERSVTKFCNDFNRLLEIKPNLHKETLDSVWAHIIL